LESFNLKTPQLSRIYSLNRGRKSLFTFFFIPRILIAGVQKINKECKDKQRYWLENIKKCKTVVNNNEVDLDLEKLLKQV